MPNTLQEKLDNKVEALQDKAFTDEYLAKKVKLEAENALLTLEINNYNLKHNLKQVKTQASGLSSI